MGLSYLLSLVLKKRLEIYKDIVPELLSITDKVQVRPKIRFHEGIDGVKRAYLGSIVAKDDNLRAFVGVERLYSESRALEHFWNKVYIPKRRRNKKFGMIVVPDNDFGKNMKRNDKRDYRETKLVPASTYNFENEIMVYDDTVVIFSASKGERYALEIESSTIANTMKMIWQMAWNLGY